MEPTKARRDEFLTLYDDFATSYLSRPKGQEHLASYNTLRQQARENFDAIVVAAERGEDVTDNVLTKLLPYTDSQAHRERGFWVHIAPAITGDVRKWFEKAGWTKPEDWRAVADAILNFLQRCTENPADLAAAAEEFADLPYSRGFQTGMLTPILNALRPDDFLLINNKSRRVINYFANTSFGQALTDYAVTNGAGRTLIEALGPDMKSGTPTVARPGDIFDTFSHWLVGIEKHDFGESSYWKIAPGENAWQWEECRGAGFIAVGWDELGDLSRLTRAEFESRRDDLVAQFPEWKEGGVDQVWKFAHIREGDRIIANRGTTEVLGIGTVAGPYTFVPNVRHGHRLPVTWDDLRLRQVNEPGWRRTLIKLDREKFAAIALAPATDGPPEELPSECPFSEKTFELLGQLHDKSSRDFYLGYKDEFKEHVEEPFQEVLLHVADRLPAPIRDVMETKSGLFSRILKNDWGRGGAWDFYWGAFYPKGSKRTDSPQLFLSINYERLEAGFHIGEYGSEHRKRFLRNCKENYEALLPLLAEPLAQPGLTFGRRLDPQDAAGTESLSWQDWLREPRDPGARLALQKGEVLQSTHETLVRWVQQIFEGLFPLVLLSTSDDPLGVLDEYLNLPDEVAEPLSPPYTLAECGEETGIDEGTLVEWVRAIERKSQGILYGPPGTGKTFVAERLAKHLVGGSDGFVELLQLHPSYAYEDFIQGIRPQPGTEGGLEYPLVPGRFLEFCKKAKARQGRCVLVLDEINRANLSRVFGELMYLLEYRDREIPLAGGGILRIPQNVRLIGTMNTADRSIALVDHALRRRFAFLPLYPNFEVLRRFHAETGFPFESLIETLTRLNSEIGDPHYHVGISFFLRKDLAEEIQSIWRMEIEPYLEEFFFDQPTKVDDFRWERIRQKVLP